MNRSKTKGAAQASGAAAQVVVPHHAASVWKKVLKMSKGDHTSSHAMCLMLTITNGEGQGIIRGSGSCLYSGH